MTTGAEHRTVESIINPAASTHGDSEIGGSETTAESASETQDEYPEPSDNDDEPISLRMSSRRL